MNLVPVTHAQAKAFIFSHHRKNKPPRQMIFCVGCEVDGVLVGVATAERPKNLSSCDGRTLEITRVCTDGTRNACSMLYGACARAAKALGYTRVITYTLEGETGASLKTSGWTAKGVSHGKTKYGSKKRIRIDRDLFGEVKIPSGPKTRWERDL